MVIAENGSGIGFFFATSKGVIQGYGYVFASAGTYGPRLIRLVSMSHFSVYDIGLADSQVFHIMTHACSIGVARHRHHCL